MSWLGWLLLGALLGFTPGALLALAAIRKAESLMEGSAEAAAVREYLSRVRPANQQAAVKSLKSHHHGLHVVRLVPPGGRQ
jgi:hypothetical protein